MKSFFLFCFLFSYVGVTNAQWTQSNGPGGANIADFVISGSNLFVLTRDNDIIRSSDNGDSWEFINTEDLVNMIPPPVSSYPYFCENYRFSTLATNGTDLILGVDYGSNRCSGSIFISSDNGDNWTNVLSYIPGQVNSIVIKDGGIFVGSIGYTGLDLYPAPSIRYSYDNGSSWHTVSIFETGGSSELAVSGSYIYNIRMYSGNMHILWRAGNGAGWEKVYTWDYQDFNSAMGANSTHVFVGKKSNAVNSPLMRSTDGESWESAGSGLPKINILKIYAAGTDLYVGTAEGVYHSDDNGSNWSHIGLSEYSVWTLIKNDEYLFAGTYGGGIFRTNDNGESWQSANNGIIKTTISALINNGNNLFAGVIGAGVHKSIDNGVEWTASSVGLDNYSVQTFAVNSNNLYTGTSEGSIYISPDNGSSWTSVIKNLSSNIYSYPSILGLAFDGTDIYAGADGGVHLSTDEGLTWDIINSGFPTACGLPGFSGCGIKDILISENNLFAATLTQGYGGYHKTLDGESWNGFGQDYNTTLANIEDYVFIGNYYNGAVYRCKNDATDYRQVRYGYGDGPVNAMAVCTNDKYVSSIIIGTGGGGVFLSLNNGGSWIDISDGLTNLDIRGLSVGPTHLFAGTAGDGVWSRSLDEIIPLNLPISIDQIYAPSDPQPINSTVNVTASYIDNTPNLALWNWGDGTTSAGVIGTRITGNHIYDEPGVYTISLTIHRYNKSDTKEYQYVVMYDPSGGFVTGGGWIYSPSGASIKYPEAVGKANFGFVSKYKKGKTVPEGNTEFQFKAGNLNFNSFLYDWLVIAGSKAKFKGKGTINGSGEYGFMISAVDGDLKDQGEDMFRIKIWDKLNFDALVYDNQIGDDDDADAATAIGGGSIVIHTNEAKSKSASVIEPESRINIYPNPFDNSIYVDLVTESTHDIIIDMIDMNGRIIEYLYTGKISAGVDHHFEFNTKSDLIPGSYMLRVRTKNGELIGREIIIKR